MLGWREFPGERTVRGVLALVGFVEAGDGGSGCPFVLLDPVSILMTGLELLIRCGQGAGDVSCLTDMTGCASGETQTDR